MGANQATWTRVVPVVFTVVVVIRVFVIGAAVLIMILEVGAEWAWVIQVGTSVAVRIPLCC